MSANIKNTIIILTLLLVTLPFIMVTDLFPFLRFGMFAEPVKTTTQKEYLILTYTNSEGTDTEFNSEVIGIEPHQFYYLIRNYYYRGESEKLINTIQKSIPAVTPQKWKIKKLVIQNTTYDTITVYQKNYEK